MSASAPLSFLQSQTLHPCGLLGRTRGYKEQESPRRELLALLLPENPDVECAGRNAHISSKLGNGGSFSLVFV